MQSELQTSLTLLEKVSLISNKYDELGKITGEGYNIFKLLKLEASEVRLHSIFIADLLNPLGTHNKGAVFLEIFVKEILGIEDYFEINQANVSVEKFLGPLDFTLNKGGFIDIIIDSIPGFKPIIFENKIYAIDQSAQLRRYFNHYNNAELIYLTLDGREPTDESTLNTQFSDKIITTRNLSYKDDIIRWLQLCLNESISFPLLRETIIQYINLLKEITNQNINTKMEQELLQLISKSPENTSAALQIAGLEDKLKTTLIKKTLDSIEAEILSMGLEIKINNEFNIGKRDTFIEFWKPEWHFKLLFYFLDNYENMIYGIWSSDDQEKDENIKAKLFNSFPNRITNGFENWYWVGKLQEWNNTSWNQVCNQIPSVIINKTKIFVETIDEYYGKEKN